MKVLLATDGSAYSEDAARFLSRFDFTPDDEITVLHVLSETPYDDDYHAKVLRLIKKVGPRILESTVQILKPLKAKVIPLAVDGYPDSTIVEHAVQNHADVVILGARGVKGVKLLVLGSVTRNVAINSPKHTLVVKKPEGKVAGPMRVLFAAVGSACCESTADFLATLPFPKGTEMTVMHVVPSVLSDIPMQFLSVTEVEMLKKMPRELLPVKTVFDDMRMLLERSFDAIDFRTATGNTTMTILNAAEEMDADLIAVGSRGLRGLKGVLGSVSRNILAYAHCPVLIGKVC
jgi:nucleotide-binding universal stress UspA family protein